MNNKNTVFTVLLVGAALAFSQGAFAESPKAGNPKWEEMKGSGERDQTREERRAKWNSMSEEEKTKFRAERKAKWDALSKEEKVKLVNERHDTMKKRMDEKWSKMSDDEKIKFAEERMKRKHEGKKRRHDEGRP